MKRGAQIFVAGLMVCLAGLPAQAKSPFSHKPAESPATEPTSTTQPASEKPAIAQQGAEVPPAPPAEPPINGENQIVTPPPLEIKGYSGRSSPPTAAPGGNFLPLPDRWRIGIPGDYIQNTRGGLFDPYNQNVLKGDYPILGQDKFLILTFTSDTLYEARRLPTPSGVSTLKPGQFGFFGNGESQLVNQNFIISLELFQGDASYKPRDWTIRATGVANGNFVHTNELDLVSPDVREGRDRADSAFAMQELFIEKKLFDLSANYDFVSVRGGIQGFNADFKGFLFLDNEPGVRLFGNYDNNRTQFNFAWFNSVFKDTNSGLNTFDSRNQNIFIANVFRQDFLFQGYTAELVAAANLDHGNGLHYDSNGFLAQPAPVGSIAKKKVDAIYLGWGGDGHIGPLNITHQFYQAFGHESFNPLADRPVQINAQFFAIELSYDRDYVRYRTSFSYSSGSHDPTGHTATGFDSIFDDPDFAGGGFSYFTRQAIPLTGSGVNLVQRNSFVPDLRTSKGEGQANFVNPGLFLYNIGVDFDVTPKLKVITNASYLQFDDPKVLNLVLQDNRIGRDIGVDLSVGVQYRPLLNNNIIFTLGASALIPASGFKRLYSSETLYSAFAAMTLTF